MSGAAADRGSSPATVHIADIHYIVIAARSDSRVCIAVPLIEM